MIYTKLKLLRNYSIFSCPKPFYLTLNVFIWLKFFFIIVFIHSKWDTQFSISFFFFFQDRFLKICILHLFKDSFLN